MNVIAKQVDWIALAFVACYDVGVCPTGCTPASRIPLSLQELTKRGSLLNLMKNVVQRMTTGICVPVTFASTSYKCVVRDAGILLLHLWLLLCGWCPDCRHHH